MSFILAMLFQAATAPWGPPVQAQWEGDGSDIKARIVTHDRPISMTGVTTFTVVLSSDDHKLRVSPFITATRGIAFEVIDQTGRAAAPREPIAISPPAPPLDDSKLTAVTPGTPLMINIGAPTLNVFPRSGKYQIRSIVSLMDVKTKPTKYKQIRSNYLTIWVFE